MAAAGCLTDALQVARSRVKRQTDEKDQQAMEAGTAAPKADGATDAMEAEAPAAGQEKGMTSAFGVEYRRQQAQEAEIAQEDDRCRRAAEALTSAFHDAIADHA